MTDLPDATIRGLRLRFGLQSDPDRGLLGARVCDALLEARKDLAEARGEIDTLLSAGGAFINDATLAMHFARVVTERNAARKEIDATLGHLAESSLAHIAALQERDEARVEAQRFRDKAIRFDLVVARIRALEPAAAREEPSRG